MKLVTFSGGVGGGRRERVEIAWSYVGKKKLGKSREEKRTRTLSRGLRQKSPGERDIRGLENKARS